MHVEVSRLQTVVSRALGRDSSRLSISPMPGGLTNINYRVDTDGEGFVLRIPGMNTSLLGINRKDELHNQRVASSLGVAPEVIAYIEPEGYILSRFVSGVGFSREAMQYPSTIERVCQSLLRFHNGPPFSGNFDVFAVCEQYRSLARKSGIQGPSDLDEMFRIAYQIESACYHAISREPRPSHNDLLNENFLYEGTRVWILDWEYSGMGDPFFDLGNFAANQQLDPNSEEFLLRCYFGKYTQTDHARLKLFRIMSDLREAMWGVAQQALSALEFDFAKYAAEFVARVRGQMSGPDYARSLDLVSKYE